MNNSIFEQNTNKSSSVNMTDSNQTQNFQYIGGDFMKIFSVPFSLIQWFFGLKWYVIFFIIIFGFFLFFQMEYAIQNRKKIRKLKKESMMSNKKTDKIKGIIRTTEDTYKNNNLNKHVSFHDVSSPSNNTLQSIHSVIYGWFYSIKNSVFQIYSLWIIPLIYVIFRNIGL